VKLLNLR